MNRFDEWTPDVAALLKEQDDRLPPPDPAARSSDGFRPLAGIAERIRLYGLGALVRAGLHRRLIYANLRLDWFHDFQEYWVGELGNRPIHPHDFHFLSGVYRQRLQTIHFDHIETPALASDDKHLDAWRDPRMVYYLFAHSYRLALSPLRVHPFIRFVPQGGRVAEYGCGAAPILTGLSRYYRRLGLRLVGADIPHLLFHYARWKFRSEPFVTLTPIPLDHDTPLTGTFDTIFCLEVLEHLPRPLPVLAHLRDVLRPGGHLIFDYVRSAATGLDTGASLRDRIPAIEFIQRHFEIVQGRVTTDGAHIAPSVARKP